MIFLSLEMYSHVYGQVYGRLESSISDIRGSITERVQSLLGTSNNKAELTK